MTLKAVDSASPAEGGINQQCSVEDLVHALLAPFAQKKEREADEEFSARTLEIVDSWMSLSESRKRECLKRLIKLTNRWRAEPDLDYGFCFTCAYYKGKGKCRAGCSPREANKRKRCGTWRVL
jgi:hypothetical protein